ncbi:MULTISPECIES: hypothetical protein [unclassified Nocardioides]|uniref:hypothetical protein n=1 Tax=unclassified Nocardioides TaxID=2615069 RepID=UPI003608A5B9
MRAYRGTWNALLAASAVFALFVGGPQLGWRGLLGAVLMLAGLGLMFGLSFAEGGQRWRFVGRCTAWFAVGGLLLAGLPHALGNAALLVLPLLGITSPPVVDRGLRWLRKRSPPPAAGDVVRLSDRDLERRWRQTSDQLHDRRTSPAAALQLVRERERLLDEMERRDPDGFATHLVRAGWRSAGSVVE